MRRRSLVIAGTVVTGLLAACGEGAGSPQADETTRQPREGDAEAARRAATPTAPAPRDETAAAVERLAAEWSDPPERKDRQDFVRGLTELGAAGLERLIVFAATDPGEFRNLVIDVAEALGDDAVPVFAKVLREQSGTARWIAACHVPSEWPWLESGPEVARALLVALEDENVETRRQVLEQLGRAGPTGVAATEAIVRRLDAVNDRNPFDDGDSEADAAFDALKSLGPDAASAFGPVARHALTFGMFPDDHSDVLAAIGPATEEDRRLLLTLLRSDDPAKRRAALTCFAEQPESARGMAAEVLPQVLGGDETIWEQEWVLSELLTCAVPDVRDAARTAVLRSLRSSSDVVRDAAIGCLGLRDGGLFDVETIRPLLEAPYPEVRAAAAKLLWAREPGTADVAVAVARGVLAEGGEGRSDAAAVLRSGIDPASPPSDWVALLASGDSDVRRVVVESLAPASEPLGPATAQTIEALARDALSEYGFPDAAAVVVRFEGGSDALLAKVPEGIRSDDDGVTVRAFEALAAIASEARWSHPDAAAPVLVRTAARLSVADVDRLAVKFGTDVAVHGAILDGATCRGDDDSAVASRRGAARLAGALGAERAVALCSKLASDPADEVRADAVWTLARLASNGADLSPAADALRRALADEDDDVRRVACGAANFVSGLRPALRAVLDDPVPVVRLSAAGPLASQDATDAAAARAVLDVLAASADDQRLYLADWNAVGAALRSIRLDASAGPVLARALREVHDCGCQREILRTLPRLGAASAPALSAVRMALADSLPCVWGWHDPVGRPDAIAALAAMGAAAAPALPDLRAVAATDRKHAEAARAAIRAIEAASR